MEANSTTNCPNKTSQSQETVLVVYCTFSATSALFYGAAILLILKAHAYGIFLYRLGLYLAIGGIFRSVAYVLQVLPVDPATHPTTVRKGWEGACVLGSFAIQYSSLFETFTAVWTCFFVFGQVFYQNKFKNISWKHESAGVIIVILAPFIFIWEPFITDSYGLTGTRCWIIDSDCHSSYDLQLVYAMITNVLPNLIPLLVGLALILMAALSLCRKLIGSGYERLLRSAMSELLPLAIYPVCYMLLVLGRLLAFMSGGYTYDTSLSFNALIQMNSFTLPLSLLLRPTLRRALCHRKNALEEMEALVPSEAVTQCRK